VDRIKKEAAYIDIGDMAKAALYQIKSSGVE